jgi:hypothetical protein
MKLIILSLQVNDKQKSYLNSANVKRSVFLYVLASIDYLYVYLFLYCNGWWDRTIQSAMPSVQAQLVDCKDLKGLAQSPSFFSSCPVAAELEASDYLLGC